MAAPRAWTMRAATSRSSEGAAPQSAEATVNSADARDERPAAAEQVGEAAAHDEEGREDDVVGVEDPGQAGDGRRRERLPDRGEGDVDDGRVEEGQEGAEAGDQQDPRSGRRVRTAPRPLRVLPPDGVGRRQRSLAAATRTRKGPRVLSPNTCRGLTMVALHAAPSARRRRGPRFRPRDGPALRFTPPCRAGFRAVAQLGSALDWGSRGRRFKSCQPDKQSSQVRGRFPM